MASPKSSTPRRREVRRNLPRQDRRWVASLRQAEALWAVALLALFTVVAGAVAISARERVPYQVGQVVDEPVVTRVSFRAVDKSATERDKQSARDREPAVYTPNRRYLDSLRQRFAGLIALADYETIEQVRSDYRQETNLDQEALSALRSFAKSDPPLQEWERLTERFLQGLFDLAVLDPERYRRELETGPGRVKILHPNPRSSADREQNRFSNVWISAEDHATLRENVKQLAVHVPRALQETMIALVMQDPQPTYLYDAQATEARRQEAYQQQPPVEVIYAADTVLLAGGTKVSEAELALLRAERRAFFVAQPEAARWAARGGIAGLVLLIGVGLWVYLLAYNPRVVRNPLRGAVLTALVLICQLVAVMGVDLQPEFTYLAVTFPTLFVVIVLAIVYGQRFALAIGAIQTVLVLLSLNLPIGGGLVMLTGVAVAVTLLGEVRTRSKVVTVGGWAGLAMAGATVLTLLSGMNERLMDLGEQAPHIGLDVFLTLVSGFGTGLLVQGMLPVIERVFGVTTAMTLKELNDASHTLLQRLAQEAPGTYQHSLRIADMAEAAADAIGADGLLCRVGAMYHDIGKINKPFYFIENQGGGPNRHNKLSPAMSLLIIVGHVKDGIEMAREYGLPANIRHFIESHHGTTLVEYFFHAARKQKEAQDAPLPSEFEFRYPGPKPQTREAAIMLLCDGIEGAARALAEPTPIRLEQVVHNMATKRLMDGQFDECSLTLMDLSRIEQAITKTLCAIYHSRIKYPGSDAKDQGKEPQRGPAATTQGPRVAAS